MQACCQPTGNCSVKTQPEKRSGTTYLRPANKADAGKLSWVGSDRERTPERIAKAVSFFERQIELRKDKSRCSRCGGPRGQVYRTCDKCRESISRCKLKAKGVAVVKGGEYSVEQLAGMVIQIRREMDKMQARFKLWQRAAYYRRNLHYRTNTIRKKYARRFVEDITPAQAMDYLKQTNHSYEETE